MGRRDGRPFKDELLHIRKKGVLTATLGECEALGGHSGGTSSKTPTAMLE